ncbi:GNAT family N-acetyltransferase [Mesorhizobium sp. NPDC059025]|uniref:GNAT family N-acetyltransferase n=1 Tax=unclassified Mesorhizobium TaxID=325217 RepID=UPI0036AA3299
MTQKISVSISIERPAGADIAALIEERIVHSQANLPPQSIHSFNLSQLDKPDITFWTARMGADLTGCGALKRHSDGTGEIKSMFVRPAWRGNGISRRLLMAIEGEAHRIGLKRLYLETGTDSLAARKLYESFGYVYCEPFGQYELDPLSVFMTKAIG